MDILFTDVHEALTDIKDFHWVDEDCGQLEVYENPPVVFPCALISVQVPEWLAIKEPAVQPGKAQVIVKMGFDTRMKPGNLPEPLMTKALAHFATVKKVTFALRGKHGTTYRGMERLSTLKTITETGIKIYTVTFSSSIVEVINSGEEEETP